MLEHYSKDEELIEKVNELERQQEELSSKFKHKNINKLSADESTVTVTMEDKIMKKLKAGYTCRVNCF